MINIDEIAKYLESSRKERKTAPFLRSLVFRSAEIALTREYGPNYSDRCLQASFAIKELLASLGIKSRVFIGAVCLSRASVGNPFSLSWAGFWGDDHHVWLVTEFGELVDLTVAQLHIHPASSNQDDEPIPAFWWQPIDVWPPVIFYLPEGECVPQLPEDEQRELKRIIEGAIVAKGELLESNSIESIRYENVIHGMDDLQQKTMLGHPWLVKSLEIQKSKLPLPLWVSQRIRVLSQR